MKKAMLAALMAALFYGVIFFAIPALAADGGKVDDELCSVKYPFHEFREFADEVWRLSAWDRAKNNAGLPPKKVLNRGELMRQCARSERHRQKMAAYWRQAKHKFYEYREHKLAWRKNIQYMKSVIAQLAGTLAAIRACESGGDYGAVDSSGTYRGAYQFDYGTWESVGGSGDPAAASKLEQDYRAAILYLRSGSSPWPVCGV